jgi:hypothetical protein
MSNRRQGAKTAMKMTHFAAAAWFLGMVLAGWTADFDPRSPNALTFEPVEARYIRMVIAASNSGTQPCVDELEVYGPTGGTNLALAATGAKAAASSCLEGFAIHRVEHLNDGKYGNACSWIAARAEEEWAQIELPKPARVARVVFSRDREGFFRDRLPIDVVVHVSSDGKAWRTVASGKSATPAPRPVAAPPAPKQPAVAAPDSKPEPPTWALEAPVAPDPNARPGVAGLLFCTLQASFEPRPARYVRVAVRTRDGAPQLDEVEVFGPDGKANLALASAGAVAGASSHAPAATKRHVALINDGQYGVASSWRGGAPNEGWVQIALPRVESVARVVVSSDRTGREGRPILVEAETYVSEDGAQWTLAGRATAPHVQPPRAGDTPADLTRAAFFKEAFAWLGLPGGGDPIERAATQYAAMIERFAGRGVDVAADRKRAAELAGRRQALASAAERGGDPSETVALFVALRETKRALMFSDPDLASVERLAFVKRHPYLPSHNYSDMYDSQFRGGGGVCAISFARRGGRLDTREPDVKVLFDAGQGISRDVALDYEAKTLWFAHMPARGDRWHLRRMPVDGGEAVQVTDGPFHDYYPCVLPDGGIAFVTTRCKMRFICWVPTTMTLFRMTPDGGDMRPLSFGNLSEWGPSVMRDGRILWTRSEYMDKGADYGHTLWALRPDGTHPELVYGNNTPHNLMNAMEVPDSGEICTTLISHFGDFNGPIAYVDPAKGRFNPDAATVLTPDARDMSNAGRVRDPVPLSRDLVLVSHTPEPWFAAATSRFGLFVLDRYGNRELLYQDPAISCMTPTPVRPRVKPPVLAHAVRPGEPGRMTVLDVYEGLGSAVKRGSVKWIRVCQELPSPLEAKSDGGLIEAYQDFMRYYAAPVDKVTSPFGWPAYEAKAVLGMTPVAEDGSAHFEVPAGKMVYFQALDGELNEIQRMRSVLHMQEGESRTCVGCHEDRNAAPVSRPKATALRKKAAPLVAPTWGAGPFAYERVVQPVLNAACVKCHGGGERPSKLDLTATHDTDRIPASYRSLVRGGYVHHFSMNWHLRHTKADPLTFGTLKSRLFAALADSRHADVRLTAEQMHALKCWVDLNVPLWPDYMHRMSRPLVAAATVAAPASAPKPVLTGHGPEPGVKDLLD